MSWRSPFTVPRTTRPREIAPARRSASAGRTHGHRRLHRLGALHQLGEEVLALLPELADAADAGGEALLDRGEEIVARGDELGQLPRPAGVAPDDRIAHLGDSRSRRHAERLVAFPARLPPPIGQGPTGWEANGRVSQTSGNRDCAWPVCASPRGKSVTGDGSPQTGARGALTREAGGSRSPVNGFLEIW